MQFLEIENNQDLYSVAEELCNNSVSSIEIAGSGANSRVYKVLAGNDNFALKFYREGKIHFNDRLDAESHALKLFENNGFPNTPHLIKTNKDRNCSLLEWIDGKSICPNGTEKIIEMCQFLEQVHHLKFQDSTEMLPLATEACLSGEELYRQVQYRLNNLRNSDKSRLDFHQFLENELAPTIEKIGASCEKQYNDFKLEFSSKIDKTQQTLSLVDFGFHNMLQLSDNTIVYLDFEYFGWDDPVKLVADTMQHPGMNLDESAKNMFFEKTLSIFREDNEYLIRLKILYPLYSLRWCEIMLNEFLPGYKRFDEEVINFKKDQHLKSAKLNRVRVLMNNLQSYKIFK
jgi:hypothetical protein